MAEMTLNIYAKDNKKEIEKTYRTNEFDLMFGTVEDILEVIDFDKLNDEKEVAKIVVSAMAQLKPFLKEVFPELTDDEIKRTKIKELVPLFVNIVTYTINEMRGLATKNPMGA